MDLTALKTLDLSNNKFTGVVHDDLSNHWGMENLEELNLSNNRFEGVSTGQGTAVGIARQNANHGSLASTLPPGDREPDNSRP